MSAPALVPADPGNGIYTFLFLADAHTLGQGDNGFADYDARMGRLVQGVNGVKDCVWPAGAAAAGQPIGPALSATVNGDLAGDTDFDPCTANQRAEFVRVFKGPIEHPCFVGLGNHDLDWEFSTLQHWEGYYDCWMQSNDFLRWWIRETQSVSSLNGSVSDPKGLFKVPSDLSYTIEFDHVVFVQLQRFGGDTKFGRPSALDWMKERLDTMRDKAVVILQHYGWDPYWSNTTSVGWTDDQKAALLAALQPYNVIGVFSGHDHTQQIRDVPGTAFSDYVSGAAKDGEFGVCRLDFKAGLMDVGFVSVDANTGVPTINTTLGKFGAPLPGAHSLSHKSHRFSPDDAERGEERRRGEPLPSFSPPPALRHPEEPWSKPL